jgi:N-acetylneuraminic acid mutarotase
MRLFIKTALFILLSSYLIYSQNNPGPRYGHTMVYYGGKVYLFGGAKPINVLNKSHSMKKDTSDNVIEQNDICSYNPATGIWESLAPINPPPKRKNHTANVWNDKMVVFGGDSSDVLKDDLWTYEFQNNTWTQLPVGGTPPKVTNHTATIEGNILVIAGGADSSDVSSPEVSQLNLNESSNGFTAKPSLPEPLQNGGMYYYNNIYWFVGGIWHDWDTSTPGNQPSYSSYIHQLTATGSNWSTVTTSGYSTEAAKFAGVFVPETNRYYIIGGEKYDYSKSITLPMKGIVELNTVSLAFEMIDPDTDTVGVKESAAVYVPQFLNQNMNKSSGEYSGSARILIFGGIDKDGIIKSDLLVFNPDDKSVIKLNSLTAPGFLAASAVSSGQINLTWTDNSESETGFVIERKTLNGYFAVIDTAAQNVTSFSDTSLLDGTYYTYRIKAIGSSGLYSDYSGEATAKTDLSAASNLTATLLNGSVVLNWSDNSQSETGFTIEKKTGTDGYTKLTDVAANVITYTDAAVTGGSQYYYRVNAFNDVCVTDYTNEAVVSVVSIDEDSSLPKEFSLAQNYPNPFNPSTIIKYNLPYSSFVRLAVYDLLGREVAVLVNQEQNAGNHQIKFNSMNSRIASGIYFYRIITLQNIEVKKMMLSK